MTVYILYYGVIDPTGYQSYSVDSLYSNQQDAKAGAKKIILVEQAKNVKEVKLKNGVCLFISENGEVYAKIQPMKVQ